MILIALGANLPGTAGATPRETCEAAVRDLANLPATRLETVSRWYRTTPVPPSGQPDYINGVARLWGPDIDPAALLAAVLAIEDRHARRRSGPNAARTLDLDLIDVNGLVRLGPDPVLPHPRAHLRAFVLVPLLDVARDWVHPGSGIRGATLLEGLDATGVRPWEDDP